MANDKLDPKVIGQLSLMQSVVNNLPDTTSIFSFVCKGLVDIPGIDRILVIGPGESVPVDHVAQMSIPICTADSDYGQLSLSFSDKTLFMPYEPYLSNFAFMIGVILEQRCQRQQIEEHKQLLEQRIQERTIELQEKNAEIKAQNEEYQQLNEELSQINQELYRAKQQTEESEEKFRLMIKNSNDTIVLINEKGEQFYISDAAMRDTGFTIEELKGPIRNVIYPDDLKIVLEAWSLVLARKGEAIRVQYRHKHKYKEYIWFEAVGQNFLDNPAIKAVVLNVRDITKIKETENELIKAKEKAEESDRLKTSFLQNMSHEIRTPMNAIMGFADLLADNFNDKEKLKKFSGIISKRSKDLLEIINDILDIAKIESGQLTVKNNEFKPIELIEELSAFFSEYQERINKGHILFEIKTSSELPYITIISDKIKLKQILINLITNAFKYTDNGSITIGCKAGPGNYLHFYVSDTGIGIPKEKHKLVFERFTQIHNNTERNVSGTGLGLPIVKGLIDILGGKISLESEAGTGSTFAFSIPVIIS
ncbi:MAG: PAS domain S-box protein [Bacteroidales bacterium]|nr:PAS domain S-box protein [Bacteroidales bacterium]